MILIVKGKITKGWCAACRAVYVFQADHKAAKYPGICPRCFEAANQSPMRKAV